MIKTLEKSGRTEDDAIAAALRERRERKENRVC